MREGQRGPRMGPQPGRQAARTANAGQAEAEHTDAIQMQEGHMAQEVWESKAADSDHTVALAGDTMDPDLNLASGKPA